MNIISKKSFKTICIIVLGASVFGCASKMYLEPTTGDTALLKFDFPLGSNNIVIYDQYQKCEGANLVTFDKNETHKEVKVKRGEKFSFTVEHMVSQEYNQRKIMTSCQNTFTFEPKEKEYEFKYVFDKGICELVSVSVNGDIGEVAYLKRRQYIHDSSDAATAPSCK